MEQEHEQFDAREIDEQLDRLEQLAHNDSSASLSTNEQLVRQLYQMHMAHASQEYLSIEHTWMRLTAHIAERQQNQQFSSSKWTTPNHSERTIAMQKSMPSLAKKSIFSRHLSTLVAVIVLAIIVASMTGVFYLAKQGKGSETSTHPATPVNIHPTTPPQSPLVCPATGTAHAATLSPLANKGNHQNLIYEKAISASQLGTAIKGALYRYDVTTGHTFMLSTVNPIYPYISPDGQWIAFTARVADRGTLGIMRIDGQDVQTLYCTPSGGAIASASWSPDQKFLTFALSSNTPGMKEATTLFLLHLNTGNVERILSFRSASPTKFVQYTPLVWSDNTHIAVRSIVYDMSTGTLAISLPTLSLLDINKGADQQDKDLHVVFQATKSCQDFAIVGFLLVWTTCTLQSSSNEPPKQIGPSSIHMQSLVSGMERVVLTMNNAAISTVRIATHNTLLFYVQDKASSYGVWKVNEDGTGLMHLITDSSTTYTYSLFNQDTRDPNVYSSNDGKWYAVGQQYGVLQKDGASLITASGIVVGSMQGGMPKSVIKLNNNQGFAMIVGWTVI